MNGAEDRLHMALVTKESVENRRGPKSGGIFFISFFLFNNEENLVIMNNWTGGASE